MLYGNIFISNNGETFQAVTYFEAKNTNSYLISSLITILTFSVIFS